MTAKGLLTIARDAISLVVGFGGIVYQQWTGEVNVYLLVVYTALLGLPGTIGLVQLGRGRQETPPTQNSSSPSPSPSSPSSSP